ncbi:MAG: YfhO family protein [Chloroflexota bacterium]
MLATTLLTYHKIAFGPGVPGGYDTQTYFFAYRQAVASALRTGVFPLWDAHIFLGAPLFANIQAAVLYPPNVMYLFWPASQAIAASLILHVWWACWGMAILCRRTFRVPWIAATVGGAMFGLGGFFSAQAGHVNQVDTAAWLPWLLLCLDLAWQGRRVGFAILAAMVVAVQFLAGHTQESYFILCVALAWGLWRLLQQCRAPRALLAIVTTGGVALAGGGALAAVQLLPTLELTSQSIRRSGLTLGEANSFSLRPDLLLIELLPGYANQPDSSEHVAYVGVLGLLIALVGLIAARRRSDAWLLAFLVVVPLALAFGQYDPLWRLAFHVVPGFSSFRVPARWLYVTTFGLASLGAIGAGAIWNRRPSYHPWPVPVITALVAVAALAGAAGIALGHVTAPAPLEPLLVTAAFVALLLLATTITTPQRGPHGAGRQSLTATAAKLLLAAAAILELVVAASWLDLNAPVPVQVYRDERQTVSYLQGHPADGRVLSIASDGYTVGDAAMLTQIATASTGAASAYRTAVATKFQDILTPNLSLAYGLESVDGYDGGILPLANYIALKQLILPDCAICANPDAILRQELTAPPPIRWLQLLGVGAVVNDRIHDFHNAGVTYDTTNTLVVPPGSVSDAGRFTAAPATVVGIITDITGVDPAAGTVVARISLEDTAGRITDATLTAGADTASLLGSSAVQPSTTLRDPPVGHAYLAQIALPDRPWLRRVTISSLLPVGNVEVRAITLHDGLTQSDTTVTLSPDGALSRVLSGDINIYHVAGAASPVFLAVRTTVTGNDSQAAAILRRPDFPLLHDAVLDYPDLGPHLSLSSRLLRRLDADLQGDPPLLPAPPPASAEHGSFTVIQQDDQLHATVDTDGAAYLVIKQSWYPGWRATVDGVPAPIYRADLALQAVAVPGGRHTIVVDYRPASVLVGAVLSALGALGLLVVAILGRRFSR